MSALRSTADIGAGSSALLLLTQTVFAPFHSVFFPESKFVYLHRKDENVFQSFLEKNQWQNHQLQYCLFDPNFPDGRFICFYENGLALESQVAWYLHVTRVFVRAFMDTMPDDRICEIESERLFELSEKHFDVMRRIIPIDDLDYHSFAESYAAPINVKTEKLQIERSELARRSERLPDLLAQLECHGGFA